MAEQNVFYTQSTQDNITKLYDTLSTEDIILLFLQFILCSAPKIFKLNISTCT